MDTSYRRAVGLADSVELKSALAVDHVTRLVALERPGVALAHCAAYLDDATFQPVVPTPLGCCGPRRTAAWAPISTRPRPPPWRSPAC